MGLGGGVGGRRVHWWVSICTHPTQECWVGGHDRQVGVMGVGWGGWSKSANIRSFKHKTTYVRVLEYSEHW